MDGSQLKRKRVYGSIVKSPGNSKRSKSFHALREIKSDEKRNNSSDSSDLSDIEGEALRLNSDIMGEVDDEDTDSISSESEREILEELKNISSPEKGICLKQSVDVEDIELTRKECTVHGRHDGWKILKEAETSLVNDDSMLALNARSRIRKDMPEPHVQYLEKQKVRNLHIERYNLPQVLTSSDLINKIQPLLPIIRDMYNGVVDSYYKYEATAVSKYSQNGILSSKEFRSLDINRFQAGFYGFRRQLRVGEEILRHFKSFLLKRQGKTMRWWGVADFANYVLAPEVLASLCILEMNLGKELYDKETRERAYELFDKTIEFGNKVADSEPLEEWEIQAENQRIAQIELSFETGSESLAQRD